MKADKNNSLSSGTVSDHPYLYDLLHKSVDYDINFYKEINPDNSEMLECGIGTGRLAIPLAEKGIKIVGLDNSKEMINFLEKKIQSLPSNIKSNIEVRLSNICDFQIDRKFKLISVPYMTFNYLMTVKDQKDCLKCIKTHLSKDGLLVLELISFFHPWFKDDLIDRLVFNKEHLDNGQRLRVYRNVRFDASTQILEHDRTYKTYAPNGKLIEEKLVLFKNRFILLGEISLLLEINGLRIKELYGDYNKNEFTKDSSLMIIIAEHC